MSALVNCVHSVQPWYSDNDLLQDRLYTDYSPSDVLIFVVSPFFLIFCLRFSAVD